MNYAEFTNEDLIELFKFAVLDSITTGARGRAIVAEIEEELLKRLEQIES